MLVRLDLEPPAPHKVTRAQLRERRRRRGRPRRRTGRRLLVAALLVLLLPVPWQYNATSRLGMAWGMDNRLVVEGHRLDPPGQYSWLTAGRPAVVGELLWFRLTTLLGDGDETAVPPTRDMRGGTEANRPRSAEPIAAAVGIAAAQHRSLAHERLTPVDAVIGGHGPPYSWFRSLSVGASHGLMVGLVTYASVSGEDLAGGRHVAGTGVLAEDGSVGIIGGLVAKALGARRAGVDVLLVPAAQQHELDGLDLGGMQVLPVGTLDDAIVQLRATRH